MSGCETYEQQLVSRVEELIPDSTADERLELLAAMDEDDLRSSLAWLVSYAPQLFDFALVRDRELVERLRERLEQADADQDLEPYCSQCGVKVGIFLGQQDKGYQHFRGEGTVASPVELFDAGHAPALSWAPAGGAQ